MAILILIAIAVCIAIISLALVWINDEIFFSYKAPQWFETLIDAAEIALPISVMAAILMATIGTFAVIGAIITRF